MNVDDPGMPVLTASEQQELDALGITVHPSVTFVYKGHRYQSVEHAKAYAKLDRASPEPDAEPD